MHLKLYFECFLREKYHVVYRFSSSRGIFKTSKVSWLLSVSFRERQITLILKILKFLSFAAMSLMRSLRSVVDDVVSGLRILEQQNQRLFPRPELALAGADGSPLHNVQNDSSVDPLGKKLKKCSPSSSLNVTWNVLASKPMLHRLESLKCCQLLDFRSSSCICFPGSGFDGLTWAAVPKKRRTIERIHKRRIGWLMWGQNAYKLEKMNRFEIRQGQFSHSWGLVMDYFTWTGNSSFSGVQSR